MREKGQIVVEEKKLRYAKKFIISKLQHVEKQRAWNQLETEFTSSTLNVCVNELKKEDALTK